MNEQPLPFTLTIEEREGYLRAHVSGSRDTVATSLAYWNAVAEECRRRGFNKVLVVENFETAASILHVYQVAEQLPVITRGLRVAFVDRREEFTENKFGETVAVNRGASGGVFPTEAAAIEWLESN